MNKVGNVEVGSIIKVVNMTLTQQSKREVYFFARVKDFDFDVKPEWYQMTFEVITPVPQEPRQLIWLLREPQINGEHFGIQEHEFTIVLILPPIKPPDGKVIPFKRKDN